jgi:hypothetical protein
MEKTTVMICGLGILGFETAMRLSQTPGLKIVAGDINEDFGRRAVNFIRECGYTAGYYPDIEFVKMDLTDVELMTKILQEYKPDLVFQVGCIMSWWVLYELPPDLSSRLTAKMAWLVPFHLLLPYKLGLALKQAGLLGKIHYVQGSFPDANNVVLDKIGLTPTVGMGNIGNYISRIRSAAAKRLNEPVRDVEVYAVFAHRVAVDFGRSKSFRGLPHYLKILLRGEDVTARVDPNQTWPEVPDLIYGKEYTPLVAESAVKVIRGLLLDTNEITHAPGPKGLPGGYPIRVSAKGVEVVLPKDITLEEAVKINNEGNRLEGIEKIESDGTIIFTDEMNKITKEVMGYDCKELKIAELEDRIRELGTWFKELGKKLGWKKVPVWI